jgi:hypothetical protein
MLNFQGGDDTNLQLFSINVLLCSLNIFSQGCDGTQVFVLEMQNFHSTRIW